MIPVEDRGGKTKNIPPPLKKNIKKNHVKVEKCTGNIKEREKKGEKKGREGGTDIKQNCTYTIYH